MGLFLLFIGGVGLTLIWGLVLIITGFVTSRILVTTCSFDSVRSGILFFIGRVGLGSSLFLGGLSVRLLYNSSMISLGFVALLAFGVVLAGVDKGDFAGTLGRIGEVTEGAVDSVGGGVTKRQRIRITLMQYNVKT